MRRLIILVSLLPLAGCANGPGPDAVAAEKTAEKYVRRMYSNVEMVRLEVEGPEYAVVPKVPDSHRTKPLDRPPACGVRVKFTWRDENRTTHDDWVVWLASDGEAVDWSGNPKGDNWRQYVRSYAAK